MPGDAVGESREPSHERGEFRAVEDEQADVGAGDELVAVLLAGEEGSITVDVSRAECPFAI